MRKVRFDDAIDSLQLRTDEGYRLIWAWGEPDEDGFYSPSLTVDYNDRLNVQERTEDFGEG